MSGVKQIHMTDAQLQATFERAEKNIKHHARWNSDVPTVTCPCCCRATYEDAVDMDVFRRFTEFVNAQRDPDPDIAAATDIAVCPDCAPGKPCEAHLLVLADLVARANAPETEAT